MYDSYRIALMTTASLIETSVVRVGAREVSKGIPSSVRALTTAAMPQVANGRLLADLRGVDVYAEDVDEAGETAPYWQSLHDFWTAYFVQAGATLARYSALRDLPGFERSSPTTADGHGR